MSRAAKTAVIVPDNVNIKIDGQAITIKGIKGEITTIINSAVKIKNVNSVLLFDPCFDRVNALAQVGTACAIVKSIIVGVTQGFTKKLQLVGVGYRVTIKHDVLNLSLGFSHLIEYKLPIGIVAECPSQTEIILTGIDKQLVGQVAANLRSYRRPEPYKGKGIRYAEEVIRIKETKKK